MSNSKKQEILSLLKNNQILPTQVLDELLEKIDTYSSEDLDKIRAVLQAQEDLCRSATEELSANISEATKTIHASNKKISDQFDQIIQQATNID